MGPLKLTSFVHERVSGNGIQLVLGEGVKCVFRDIFRMN